MTDDPHRTGLLASRPVPDARAGSATGSDGMLARLLAGSATNDEAKELLHDAVCSDGAPEPRGREPPPGAPAASFGLNF